MATARSLSPPPARVRAGAVSFGNLTASSPGVSSRTLPTPRSLVGFGGTVTNVSLPSSSRRAVSRPSPRQASTDTTDTNGVTLDDFEQFIVELQQTLCDNLERIDMEGFGNSEVAKDASILKPGTFIKDAYSRPGGHGSGFGITRVMENGAVFEKAAANVSIIRGVLSPERARAMSSRGRSCVDPHGGQTYAAAALSLVFHPRSPFVPTFRADVRRFTVAGNSWYGGGADLTPYYLFDEDAFGFHESYRELCNEHDPEFSSDKKDASSSASFFSKLVSSVKGHKSVTAPVSSPPEKPSLHASCKTWCDEYFYIPARKEHRGVGGVFFDDVVDHGSDDNKSDDDKSNAKSNDDKSDDYKSNDDSNERVKPTNAARFTKAIGENWLQSYEPIVKKRWEMQYIAAHEKWHHQRRGRYVEFNLLYDRGVRFGLDGGRVESIMVSAPPRVRWVSISNNHIPPTDCPYETDIYFYNLRTIASIRRRGRRRRGWWRF